ncbi:DUF4276 family protein [Methanocalculus chunghsingensis]|nr:DUF4276 family protein [Methanocalculus chunghsingensis]
MPRLVASGSRDTTFSDLKTALKSRKGRYIAMLIDSEDPIADPERTWDHLIARDAWKKPDNCDDENVLFMTTCMETWIVLDREALKKVFGPHLQESALPSPVHIECTKRHEVQKALIHATRNTTQPYAKGKVSFELVGKLNPDVLEEHLVAFQRMKRILDEKLQGRVKNDTS